MIVVI